MITIYENDLQGLVQYFNDKWNKKVITGSFSLEGVSSDTLINGHYYNGSDVERKEIPAKLLQYGNGLIEISPLSLIIQKKTQVATLTFSIRQYYLDLKVEQILEKSLIDTLLKKPASFKKQNSLIFLHSGVFKEKFEVTETLDLTSLTEDFKKLDEWLLEKANEVVESDLAILYNGQTKIKNERMYDSFVRLNPDYSAFRVELN